MRPRYTRPWILSREQMPIRIFQELVMYRCYSLRDFFMTPMYTVSMQRRFFQPFSIRQRIWMELSFPETAFLHVIRTRPMFTRTTRLLRISSRSTERPSISWHISLPMRTFILLIRSVPPTRLQSFARCFT